ncbi:DUF397 domain-containing protein [Streptomyces sp. NBC_00388]|uniref:DUF397 domain-containing protein n=1 Tax=Streptomyces sp. NBC_00388 TaxID=2975735 RepID=UPI002E1E3A48
MTEQAIPDTTSLSGWRKSTYSGSESGSCVEVLDNHPSGVPVRDSKVTHGPALVFTADRWASFIGALKDGVLPR